MDPVVIEYRLTINVNGSPYVAIAVHRGLPELAADIWWLKDCAIAIDLKSLSVS
jgi:hypothetical protein